MSAWVEGKLELKCSLDILRKAIINIRPEWEGHLLVDPDGNIPMYRFNHERAYKGKGGDKTVHLCIPGSGHPDIKTPPGRGAHNDWGFKRTPDEKWEVTFADFGLEKAKKLEAQIKGEIAIMKAKAIAIMRGFEIITQEDNNEEKSIDIRVDSTVYQDLVN